MVDLTIGGIGQRRIGGLSTGQASKEKLNHIVFGFQAKQAHRGFGVTSGIVDPSVRVPNRTELPRFKQVTVASPINTTGGSVEKPQDFFTKIQLMISALIKFIKNNAVMGATILGGIVALIIIIRLVMSAMR